MRTVIDTREGPDGVFRPKGEGLAGALDDLEELMDAGDRVADFVDAGAERLNGIMERRKFLRSRRRRAPLEAEKVTDE